MLLSCCDLLAVVTSHPVTALTAMLWFTENINVYPAWLLIYNGLSNMFFSFSLLALFLMNFDRYLATHYPFFHRTSVTKGKLFTLFAFAAIIQTTLMGMSINDLVIPYEIGLLICCIIFIPPMLFTNYKLFTIARKSRRISPEMKKSFSLKNISSILLVAVPFSKYKTLTKLSWDLVWFSITVNKNRCLFRLNFAVISNDTMFIKRYSIFHV